MSLYFSCGGGWFLFELVVLLLLGWAAQKQLSPRLFSHILSSSRDPRPRRLFRVRNFRQMRHERKRSVRYIYIYIYFIFFLYSLSHAAPLTTFHLPDKLYWTRLNVGKNQIEIETSWRYIYIYICSYMSVYTSIYYIWFFTVRCCVIEGHEYSSESVYWLYFSLHIINRFMMILPDRNVIPSRLNCFNAAIVAKRVRTSSRESNDLEERRKQHILLDYYLISLQHEISSE